MNLEDEESMKRLVSECQARGISPSSLKHLKYLRRFLTRVNQVHKLKKPYFFLVSWSKNSILHLTIK